MPKKSDSRKENRGHSGNKAGREERGGNLKDSKQQGRQDGSVNLDDYRQQSREEGSGEIGDLGGYRKLLRGNRKLFQGKGLVDGTQKKSCLPKLFMLVLPFLSAGAYLLLRS